jgi:hypothetical protein
MIELGSHFQYISEKMKSKDMQTAVKNQYENGDDPTKNYRALDGVVSLRTIQSWIQMINKTGSINSSYSLGHSRTLRTKVNISKYWRRDGWAQPTLKSF